MSTLFALEEITAPQVADAAERLAALDVEQSFLVEAPAGSGKTGLLVQRLLKLLCLVERPESVLALTFTNKATAEMRERVLRALDLTDRDAHTLSEFDRITRDLALELLHHDRQLGWDLRSNSHRLNIRTIDSLCGEIARSLPLTSGTVGQMSPVNDAAPLYRRAARAVMLRLGGDDELLNEALRTVLLHRDGDLHNCETLLAGMLADREQWGTLVPLTADELRDDVLEREIRPRLDAVLQGVICATLQRLEQAFPPSHLHTLADLAIELSTLEGHNGDPNPVASCAHMLRVPGSEAVDLEHWLLLAKLLLNNSHPYQWRKSLAKNHLGIVLDKKQKARLEDLIAQVQDSDRLRELLCELRELPPSNMPEADWQVAKALFRLLHHALLELQLLFQAQAACDFTERSLAARAALRSGEARDLKGDTPGMRLEHLLVDEMQDTSNAQYELLESLTQGWDGRSQTVFLVGDPKQSIYLFRQARVERFLESLHTKRLGHLPLEVLRLSSNFRSGDHLVSCFNELFGPVFASPSSGGIPYASAVASADRPGGLLRWQVQPQTGEQHSEERTESRMRIRREQAEDVAKSIHDLRSSASSPSIAVLVRSREHAASVTRKLKEANIPFRGVDLESLSERPEVLDALALTRALLHPADRVAWLAVLRAPWCGATLSDLHVLAAGEQKGSAHRALRRAMRERFPALPVPSRTRISRTLDVLDVAVANLGRMPLSHLVEQTARALGTGLYLEERQRTNVRRYLELIAEAEAELTPISIGDLKTRLARLYAAPDTTPGAVDVMTVHKAKGLEWDVVFLPEMHRTSGRNGQRMLDWLELPNLDAEGRPQVILAPIAPRGAKTAALAGFVQRARKRQEEAELSRVLYVAITRARTELHLYAAPELRKDGGVSARSGTLLCAAWPGAGATVQRLAEENAAPVPQSLKGVAAGAEELEAVLADVSERKRVPANFDPEQLSAPTPLPWLQASAGTAATLPLEMFARPQGSLASRALGTTIHLFLEQLAARFVQKPGIRVEEMLCEVPTWGSRIRAVLRGMAVHGRTLEEHTRFILNALNGTLSSAEGRWLLQPHAGAANEEVLRTEDGGEHHPAFRLDRSFVAGREPNKPGQDTLWIVDYKTATPAEGQSVDAFLTEERERYAPQLRNYARLRAKQPGTPASIMLALFYPAVPRLDYWPVQQS